MKIFIYFPNWLGDAAMAIPALNLLTNHYPNASLIIYANAPAAALCEGYGKIICEDKKRRFKQFLSLRKAHKFDLIINFKASFSSRFFCLLLRAKKRLFFHPQKNLQMHQIAKYAQLLNPLNIDTSALSSRSSARFFYLQSSISAPENLHPKIAELFCEKNATKIKKNPAQNLLKNRFRRLKSRGFLGIACGAAYGSAKSYEDFAALARLLAPHFRGILLFGARAELASAELLASELGEISRVKNLCCKTSVKRLAAALCGCDLVLCNDSGIMHMCAMLELPCAVVFGATNPAQTAAYSASAMIFSTLASCSPCKKRQCPKKHHFCMKKCAPEQIAAIILSAQNANPPGF